MSVGNPTNAELLAAVTYAGGRVKALELQLHEMRSYAFAAQLTQGHLLKWVIEKHPDFDKIGWEASVRVELEAHKFKVLTPAEAQAAREKIAKERAAAGRVLAPNGQVAPVIPPRHGKVAGMEAAAATARAAGHRVLVVGRDRHEQMHLAADIADAVRGALVTEPATPAAATPVPPGPRDDRPLTVEERTEDFRLHAESCGTCRDPSRQEAFTGEELCPAGATLWALVCAAVPR